MTYRDIALEQTTDDLFEMAEHAGRYRQCYLAALALLADRERRLEISREAYRRLRDENRELRAQITRPDLGRAA